MTREESKKTRCSQVRDLVAVTAVPRGQVCERNLYPEAQRAGTVNKCTGAQKVEAQYMHLPRIYLLRHP